MAQKNAMAAYCPTNAAPCNVNLPMCHLIESRQGASFVMFCLSYPCTRYRVLVRASIAIYQVPGTWYIYAWAGDDDDWEIAADNIPEDGEKRCSACACRALALWVRPVSLLLADVIMSPRSAKTPPQIHRSGCTVCFFFARQFPGYGTPRAGGSNPL